MSGSSQRLLTFLFEGAQSVFSHASEDRQPIKEYPTFVFVTRIECQFVNSPSNCFLSLLYLFTQLLRIEFENCRSEGFLPLWICQIHYAPSRLRLETLPSSRAVGLTYLSVDRCHQLKAIHHIGV